jgi:hypothetical protein
MVPHDALRRGVQAGLGAFGPIYSQEGWYQPLRCSVLSVLGARPGNENREMVGNGMINDSSPMLGLKRAT